MQIEDMMKNKIFILLVIFSIVVYGCGGGKPGTGSTGSSPSECQTDSQCTSVPSNSCSGTRRTVYIGSANCVNGKCQYASSTVECSNNNGWVTLSNKKCNGDSRCSFEEYREYSCTTSNCTYAVTQGPRVMDNTCCTCKDGFGEGICKEDKCFTCPKIGSCYENGRCQSGATGFTPSAECGDGSCNNGETCSSCAQDCGTCNPFEPCGDGTCGSSETCSSCFVDCGSCQSSESCGNGQCMGGESCSSCESDCGQCPSETCGNGQCINGEDCNSCESDCGSCGPAQCGFGYYPDENGICCGPDNHKKVIDGKCVPSCGIRMNDIQGYMGGGCCSSSGCTQGHQDLGQTWDCSSCCGSPSEGACA